MSPKKSEKRYSDPNWKCPDARHSCYRTGVWVIGSLLLLVSGQALAARWSVTPLLVLSETATDNVALAPDAKKESEDVTEVTPGVQIRGQTPTLKLNAGLQFQNLYFSKDPTRNASHTIVFANGVQELLPSSLFLDFSAERSPEVINLNRSVPIDAISDTGNLADVSQYSIGPRVERRFGSYGRLSANYRHGAVNYDSNAAADSVVDDASFSADGGVDPSYDWKWNANALASRIDRQGEAKEERNSGSAELGRRLGPKWVALLRGGYSNDELPAPAAFNNGSYWAAGVEWLPTDRTDVRVLYGDHYKEARVHLGSRGGRTDLDVLWQDLGVGAQSSTNGNVYGTFRHRGGRTTWEAHYTKESTNESLIRVVETQVPGQVDPVTGEPLTPDRNILSLSSDNYILTRWELSTLYHGTRSDIGLGVYDEARDYLVTAGRTERAAGGNASWAWRFKAFTSFLLEASAERSEPTGGRTDDLRLYYLGLRNDAYRGLTISLIYRRADLQSTDPTAEFKENRVTLRFEKRFR